MTEPETNGTAPAVTVSDAEQLDTERLDRSLVHGVAWTGAGKWVIQLASWATTLLVARILSPSDYGVVSLATVYLGILTLVSDFGVGAGIVALRDLTEEQIAQTNGLAVLLGIAGFSISCLIAVPAGRFFHSRELPLVLVIMSSSFVVSSFQSVPTSLLRKELRFKLLSIIDAIRSVLLAVLAVALAVAGMRYWTLVIGAVASAAVGTALTLAKRRHRFAWPRFAKLRAQVQFSRNMTISNVAWHTFCNADYVVAGRVLGQSALGSYTVAYNLAAAPLDKITAMISGVTPAYFAAVQKDPAALRRYLLKPTEVISFLTFPALIGLSLVAPDAVRLVLGNKWEGAIVPLQLLALLTSIRSIVPFLPQILSVVGETSFLMWNSVVAAVVLPVAFYFGSRWGTAGIAAAWVAAYPVYAVPIYIRTFRKIGLQPLDYVRALRPALDGSIVMAIVVFGIRWLMPASAPLWSRLAAQIAAGAVAYSAVQLLIYRTRLSLFRRAAQMIRT